MELSEKIKQVCDEIVAKFSPERVYLFNVKHDLEDEPRGFKLCIVVDKDDNRSIEKRIYLEVESDIPFDILVYTSGEWDGLISQHDSFAKRITEKGTIVYERQI
jgi:hypothetical protein